MSVKRPSLLRMLFLNNGSWKLFALAISVLIYFSIRADISHRRTLTIPVEAVLDGQSGGAAIESVEPRSVQVTLRGSYSDVNQVSASSLRCVVRPKLRDKAILDAVEVRLDSASLLGARGVRVVKFEPPVAVVKFDVPVMLRLDVAPPALTGRARGRVELVYEQTNAWVKGSRRLLSPLDTAKVRIQPEAIDVDGRSQTFGTSVRLLPPGGAETAVVEPGEMVVQVRITSEKASTRLERVPVFVLHAFEAGPRWRAEPEGVDIEVTGRSEIVRDIGYGSVTATVVLHAPLAPAETNMFPVTVQVRQGLALDDAVAQPGAVRLVPVETPAGKRSRGL